MATTHQLAEQWLRQDQDPVTRAEIEDLVVRDDEPELERRLRQRIAFGTAGLRSSMKAGYAHMNSLTVLQASLGLAEYIKQQRHGHTAPCGSVVVGYDARHNSEKFARLAAAAFLEKGLGVLWMGQHVHTPMVPYAVTHFGAAAGVMVTASHNPKNDNGYKVYWSNGSQIIPPHDTGIASAIDNVRDIISWDTSLVDRHAQVQHVFAEVNKSYFASIQALVMGSSTTKMTFGPFLYTPMHGVGLPFMQQVADILGASGMQVVSSQAQPDAEFPTVPFPNPEEKGALDLAIQHAKSHGVDIILANDPDADRFSAAERLDNGTYHQFTGNQIGSLLASYVLETYAADKSRLVMLASTVSSRMLAAMAAREGFQFRETLTGFKWLGNVAHQLREHGLDPAFAFEEAIGYMFPTVVWDKDGIAAAAVFLVARELWRKEGRTPYQKLQELHLRYGHFEDANTYLVSPSPSVTNTVFQTIRTSGAGVHPGSIGKRPILRWRDLTLGYDSGTADHKPVLPVDPSGQMITCELENVVLTVRASGTEPKIKLYIEAKGVTSGDAKKEADEVLGDLLKEWFQPEYYGLKLAGM